MAKRTTEATGSQQGKPASPRRQTPAFVLGSAGGFLA